MKNGPSGAYALVADAGRTFSDIGGIAGRVECYLVYLICGSHEKISQA